MPVCMCVYGETYRDNNTLYITRREITFPGISMSHCAKCHWVPVKGCLLNCHNFFNDGATISPRPFRHLRGVGEMFIRLQGSFHDLKVVSPSIDSYRIHWGRMQVGNRNTFLLFIIVICIVSIVYFYYYV